MQFRLLSLLLLLSVLIISACHPTKHLATDQLLYNGATLKKSKSKSDQPKKNLYTSLYTKVRQTPNRKIFGKRFKLWVYQQFINHQKEKGFRYWIKTKIGEAPVIYNHNLTEQSRRSMEQHLRDNGFLNARVNIDTTIKGQVINVKYLIAGNGQFRINNYFIPPDTTELLTLINAPQKRPLIKSGKSYTLAAINAERLRIESLARNNGFYEFDQSALYFYLDTTSQVNKQLDVYLTIKKPRNQKNYRPYELGNINLYPDYALNNSSNDHTRDTIKEGIWQLIQNKAIVKLSALQETIAQDSGAVYSEKFERQAINYLLDLGIFKFVNLKYEKVFVDSQAILHRNFYLTPSLNQDIGMELEASTQRSSPLGSSIGFNYVHRNIFRGAEQFKTGLSFGFETQSGGGGPFINTLEANFNAGLAIPRLLLPFKITKRLKSAIPKTLINFNGSFQKRNTLFTSLSLQLDLNYTWKQNQFYQHQFSPLKVTLLQLLNTSEAFDTELINNPRLKASFNDLLIFSAGYRFTYSNQKLNKRKNYFYFRGEVETAGTISSLFAKTNTNDPDEPKTLLHLPVAQFSSIQAEISYTWYQKKTSLVGRISTGLAIPYGNSEATPYIRQFFVGGANSNRAFRFRGVGPGSYSPDPTNQGTNLAFFDRVGDLKLEGNIEYRFPSFLSEYLKFAVFLDAGNVWLTRAAGDQLPEGAFKFNRFYKELAIGTGLGFRVDIQYVVLRFDFGIPVRDPSRAEDDRWLLQKIQLGSKAWRSENLTFNLAIGYPF